jgi:hypothetical protein
MQQDNTIIQKLQQLDNQQLPDLSQMDAHWQRMEAMLAPTAPAKKPGGKALRWWLPAALLLVATAWLAYRYTQRPQATAHATDIAVAAMPAAKPDTIPTAVWTTSGDTLKLIQQPAKRQSTPPQRHSRNGNNSNDALSMVPPAKPDTQYFNINFIPCIDSAAADGKAGNLRQQWLNEFYTQLKKEPNQFVIDNRKDTLLHCKEGTSLQIPTGSLGGYASVEFTVTEVYKKSDMVLNQLSATSNKALLESGGMLRLSASVGGQPVEVVPNKPITVYMADTSSYMQEMQLFTGEKTTDRLPSAVMRLNEKMEDVSEGVASTYMNWIPQYRYFTTTAIPAEVRVLNLDDNYIELRERKRGLVAVYLRSKYSKLSRRQLQQRLEEKYGDQYYKIKVKNHRPIISYNVTATDAPPSIGDSIWIKKELADKWKLPYYETRNARWSFVEAAYDTVMARKLSKSISALQKRYGIHINRLGWINCDRFYNSNAEKTNYVVQLGDSAMNYHTLLVFNKINSVMNGYVSGNTVIFYDIPIGMKVTVVSVGINQKGQSVYAMKKAVTDKTGLSGIHFQSADAVALPNALSQLDR